MKRIIYLFIIALSVSCMEAKPRLQDADALYKINLDSIEKKNVPFLESSMFKSVRTIILDDDEYAVIGHIDQLQVFENYLFIMDGRKAKKLFIYNKEGKFVRQIGSQGQGPGEYTDLYDFCLDTKKREIYILDISGKVLKYNFDDGKFIKSLNFDTSKANCFYISLINNKLYTAIVSHDAKVPGNLLLEMDIETGNKQEYLDANTYNYGWNRAVFNQFNFLFGKHNNSQRFVARFMNTIMSIDKDGVKPYISLYHKDWVRNSDINPQKKLEELVDQQSELFKAGRVWMEQHNYIESNNFIYFQCNRFYLVIDKNTQKATRYKSFEHDLIYSKEGLSSGSFVFYNSQAAYSIGYMPYFIEKIHENDILRPDLDKKDELLKLKDVESIVIFEYEFK
ncbi:MAG: 6-bladed beta-propeller [Prevotellaceae bacterium]|jgi:hypothetical protein|nr:6-bladed beta-propeller [Prevotellaceae bacterium]